MDMKLLVIVVVVLTVFLGPAVLVALGPLWVIALVGFAVLWLISSIGGDD